MSQFSKRYNTEERTAKFGENIIIFCQSKKDFRNKIFICKKEAQETKHWLRMIIQSSPKHEGDAHKLRGEAQELTMIFQKITSSLNKEP